MKKRCAILRAILVGVCLLESAGAQTKVDLRTQSKDMNFGTTNPTSPFQIGASLPATCSVGQAFFQTTSAAGLNLYGCTAVNSWTLFSAGVLLGDVTGTPSASTVSQLQGRPMSATAPTSGQSLAWNSGANSWTPQTQLGRVENAGTILPVEPNLNFAGGGCTDNPGNSRTDCTGMPGPGYGGSSSTSLTIGTGPFTLTTQSGLAYNVGAIIQVNCTASPTNYFYGTVTSYSGTTLAFDATLIGGSGTCAAWTLNLGSLNSAAVPAYKFTWSSPTGGGVCLESTSPDSGGCSSLGLQNIGPHGQGLNASIQNLQNSSNQSVSAQLTFYSNGDIAICGGGSPASGCPTPLPTSGQGLAYGGGSGAGLPYLTTTSSAPTTCAPPLTIYRTDIPRTYDCINGLAISDSPDSVNLKEEFASTSGSIGSLGWSFSNVNTSGCNVGGGTTTSSHPGLVSIGTASTGAGYGCTFYIGPSSNTGALGALGNLANWWTEWIAEVSATSNVAWRIGLGPGGTTATVPVNSPGIFRYDTSLQDVVSATCNDAGNKCGLTTLTCTTGKTVTFNIRGGTATGSVACTGTNAIANSTAITVVSAGAGYNATGGAAVGLTTGGTATFTGNIALTTTLGSAGSGADTVIMACVINTSQETCASTGQTPSASTFYDFYLSSSTAATMTFQVGTNSAVTLCASGCTATATPSTAVFGPLLDIVTESAAAVTSNVDYWQFLEAGLSR
jgi:hypothetical protein